MENKTKLLAEKYLYTAASRFFEEPDCVELSNKKKLDEKRMQITDPETGKTFYADVPDSILYQAKLADDAFEEMGEEDFTAAAEPAILAKQTAAAAKASADAKAKDLARFKANTSTKNDNFSKLLPAIKGAIANAAVEGVETGKVVSTDSGVWMVNHEWAGDTQKQIFKDIVAPVLKELDKIDKTASKALRDSWEFFIGWRGGRGYKLAPFKNAIVDYAKNNIKVDEVDDEEETEVIGDSCGFNKRLFKCINEALAKMYAERYSVTLDEATKMYVVDDSKFID